MNSYVLSFQEIDRHKLMAVGGKGANLGELSRIEGIRVPEGFCITTEAYKKIINETPELDSLLEQLSLLKTEDRKKISEISGMIRRAIEGIIIPKDIEEEVLHYLARYGENNAYAVRSSATAEDLPTASFAGQQDTYLNIKGKDSILKHISMCWASLFTDRAVTYRIRNNFGHSKVYLSVIVQRMVFPQASGIMFTADPVTSNRKVSSIDASLGLGEALVSGLVNADIYKVREGRIVDKKVSTKKLAIYAIEEGGTEEREIETEHQNMQTLTDEQILQLERMGRTIESYFGNPQDIEWCLYENKFYIVQSRPITTLYPVSEVKDDKNHVYISFGHRQMMTEAMKPLGRTFYQELMKRITGSEMPEMGGRLYMDMSRELASPFMSKFYLKSLVTVDVLMQKALYNLMKRKDFVKNLYRGKTSKSDTSMWLKWGIDTIKVYRQNDPEIVKSLIAQNEAFIQSREVKFANLSGVELFDFILKDFEERKNMERFLREPTHRHGLIRICKSGWAKRM